MLEKLAYWLQQFGDKVTDVMFGAVVILLLIVIAAQVALLAGALPRGWMP